VGDKQTGDLKSIGGPSDDESSDGSSIQGRAAVRQGSTVGGRRMRTSASVVRTQVRGMKRSGSKAPKMNPDVAKLMNEVRFGFSR